MKIMVGDGQTTGQRVRYLRECMRLSQTELGRLIDIYPQNISAWERDQRKPGVSACQKLIFLANKYNIEIDINYLRPI